MTTTSEIFRDTQALAEFSNLPESKVEYFRQNFRGFVPQSWWEWGINLLNEKHVKHLLVPGTKELPKSWRGNQLELCEAWAKGFPLENCVRLISAGGAFPDTLAEAAKQLSEPGEAPDKLGFVLAAEAPDDPGYVASIASDEPIEPELGEFDIQVWPYQRAVMFLAVEPWRARFCSSCGKRFVADAPKRQYCSDACFQKNRKQTKLSWWKQNGEEWRSGRKKEAKRRKIRKQS